jgi:hypothetical protein
MTLYADVILFDTVGTPYTGKTREISGMGGSEFQAILLLEELANLGKKVICLNNINEEMEYNGVLYLPNTKIFEYKFICDNLISHRTSVVPKLIKHKNFYQWVTDNNSVDNLPYYDLLENNKCKLITLSNFSNTQFPNNWNKTIIPFMIPDWVYSYEIPTVKNNYIYASSLMKGYRSTLGYWSHLKSKRMLQNKRLYVCLPGYDNPTNDISVTDLQIDYFGTKTFREVVHIMSTCEGMFYVNVVPETFCISAVLAEILKTNTNIYCTNGVGALTEVLNCHNVTTNMKQFVEYFDDGKPNIPIGCANDYKSSTVIKQWIKLFS